MTSPLFDCGWQSGYMNVTFASDLFMAEKLVTSHVTDGCSTMLKSWNKNYAEVYIRATELHSKLRPTSPKQIMELDIKVSYIHFVEGKTEGIFINTYTYWWWGKFWSFEVSFDIFQGRNWEQRHWWDIMKPFGLYIRIGMHQTKYHILLYNKLHRIWLNVILASSGPDWR